MPTREALQTGAHKRNRAKREVATRIVLVPLERAILRAIRGSKVCQMHPGTRAPLKGIKRASYSMVRSPLRLLHRVFILHSSCAGDAESVRFRHTQSIGAQSFRRRKDMTAPGGRGNVIGISSWLRHAL